MEENCSVNPVNASQGYSGCTADLIFGLPGHPGLRTHIVGETNVLYCASGFPYLNAERHISHHWTAYDQRGPSVKSTEIPLKIDSGHQIVFYVNPANATPFRNTW